MGKQRLQNLQPADAAEIIYIFFEEVSSLVLRPGEVLKSERSEQDLFDCQHLNVHFVFSLSSSLYLFNQYVLIYVFYLACCLLSVWHYELLTSLL